MTRCAMRALPSPRRRAPPSFRCWAAIGSRPATRFASSRCSRAAGTAPGAIVSAALRQVAQLHKARLVVEEGAAVGDAVQGIQPFVHFSRKGAIEAALKTWTSARLERAMADLAEAALEARRQSAMAELIAQRALLMLAVNARRKD